MRTFFENHKTVPILNYASQTTARTSEVIDTKGFGRVYIGIQHAAVHDSAVATMNLAHSDAVTNETTLSGGADVLGTSQAISTTDNTFQYWDGTPTKRYLQVEIANDGAQATAQSGFAILYNAKNKPIAAALGTSTVGEGTGTVTGEATMAGWTTGTA